MVNDSGLLVTLVVRESISEAFWRLGTVMARG